MAYKRKRNWFKDWELQVYLDTLTIGVEYSVAGFGVFDYKMKKGKRLELSTSLDRRDFLLEARHKAHILIPIGFTYSSSNLNAKKDNPVTSDHTAVLYCNMNTKTMQYFDANTNETQWAVVKDQLRPYLQKNWGNDIFTVEIHMLKTFGLISVKDGCSLTTMFAIEEILNGRIDIVLEFAATRDNNKRFGFPKRTVFAHLDGMKKSIWASLGVC